MALSSRIQTISVRIQGGGAWEYTLRAKDFSIEHQPVFWNNSDADEALDGSLRQNLRGFRIFATIEWEKLTDDTVTDEIITQDKMRYLLNDIINSLANDKDDGVEIDFDNAGYNLFVPTNLQKITRFQNQIARASSRLEFKSQQIFESIPERFEAPIV